MFCLHRMARRAPRHTRRPGGRRTNSFRTKAAYVGVRLAATHGSPTRAQSGGLPMVERGRCGAA